MLRGIEVANETYSDASEAYFQEAGKSLSQLKYRRAGVLTVEGATDSTGLLLRRREHQAHRSKKTP